MKSSRNTTSLPRVWKKNHFSYGTMTVSETSINTCLIPTISSSQHVMGTLMKSCVFPQWWRVLKETESKVFFLLFALCNTLYIGQQKYFIQPLDFLQCLLGLPFLAFKDVTLSYRNHIEYSQKSRHMPKRATGSQFGFFDSHVYYVLKTMLD